MGKYLSLNFNLEKLARDTLVYVGRKLIGAGKGYTEVLELVNEKDGLPGERIFVGNNEDSLWRTNLIKLDDASLMGNISGRATRYDYWRESENPQKMDLSCSSFRVLGEVMGRDSFCLLTSGRVDIYRNEELERRIYHLRKTQYNHAQLITRVCAYFIFLRKLRAGSD